MERTARTAAAGLALVAALAGCATTTAGSGTPAAGATAGGGGLPTALPSPSDVGPPTTAPAPTSAAPGPGGTVRLGSVGIPVPAGGTAKVQGDSVCLTLPGATGCSLEVVDIGRIRAAGGSVSTPAPGEPNGWWWGSDVPSCGDGAGAVTRSTVVAKGFQRVGPKNAAYGAWRVTCQDPGQDFGPRLWWLPNSQVAFRQRATVARSGDAVDRILAGVTFDN